jgi:hypothetical protein
MELTQLFFINFTSVAYTESVPLYWQTSHVDNQYAIPSIIPTMRPVKSMPHTMPIMSQSMPNSMSYMPYHPSMFNYATYSPILISRVATPPLNHCRECSSTYICPHHFRISPLAPYFCCHYCYTLHTFSSRSPQRQQFYRC